MPVIIDFHAHLEFKTPQRTYTAAEFVAGMNQGGIDKSVLFGNDQADAGGCPPWRDARAMAVPTNWSDEDVAAFCATAPERLIGLTSVNPNRYRPERKVERAIKEFGLRGVKLYPHSGFYPNDPRLDRVYDLCSHLHVPVVIHTGPKAVRWQWLKYNNPLYVDDVATNFPDLNIVMCHGGYPWTEAFTVVAYSNPNVWVDLTFMDYIERTFQVPGLVENTVHRLVCLVGPQRLLWGSEGPYMNLPLFGQHEPDYYARSQQYLVRRFDFLSEDDKAAILGRNAARLLGL
ncbi:MAG TPA: amidohydrolase family protein [Anaerolineae bacterium]|nr:amidohydrolase family protein [Anaerolineae bacterium]HPL29219.1 amidohydrolase family protein [Anaerolineae bacterium]